MIVMIFSSVSYNGTLEKDTLEKDTLENNRIKNFLQDPPCNLMECRFGFGCRPLTDPGLQSTPRPGHLSPFFVFKTNEYYLRYGISTMVFICLKQRRSAASAGKAWMQPRYRLCFLLCLPGQAWSKLIKWYKKHNIIIYNNECRIPVIYNIKNIVKLDSPSSLRDFSRSTSP